MRPATPADGLTDHQIDGTHSSVEFVGRHLTTTKVRGSFSDLGGHITVGEDPRDSRVGVEIGVASLSTGNADRDDHLRSVDFFDAENHPTITFRSTSVEALPETTYELVGELTARIELNVQAIAAAAGVGEPGRRGAMTEFPLVFGLDTFGDVTLDAEGRPLSHAQTIRDVVEQGVFAEQVGLDFFGIGEHHTDDFPMSAADVVLGAIASRTERIHLGSAVTVLSSDDPVRVFQRYSTLDAVSGGRAEVILGRGSSIDSFPLFGFDLADYEQLFEEKTDLFARLLDGGPVSWSDTTPALQRPTSRPGRSSGRTILRSSDASARPVAS